MISCSPAAHLLLGVSVLVSQSPYFTHCIISLRSSECSNNMEQAALGMLTHSLQGSITGAQIADVWKITVQGAAGIARISIKHVEEDKQCCDSASPLSGWNGRAWKRVKRAIDTTPTSWPADTEPVWYWFRSEAPNRGWSCINVLLISRARKQQTAVWRMF